MEITRFLWKNEIVLGRLRVKRIQVELSYPGDLWLELKKQKIKSYKYLIYWEDSFERLAVDEIAEGDIWE